MSAHADTVPAVQCAGQPNLTAQVNPSGILPQNAPVTISGRLTGADGAPVAGHQLDVRVSYPTTDEQILTKTAADGTYSVTFTARDRAESWGVWANSAGDEARCIGYLSVQNLSGFTRFTQRPLPPAEGLDATVGARLILPSYGPDAGIIDTTVAVEFSTDKKTWKHVGYAHTYDHGGFTYGFVAGHDGYFRFRYDGSETILPSVSEPYYVDVKTETAFQSFNAAPEPVAKGGKLTASGTLLRRKSPQAFVPASGAKVAVQFRADGSSAWATVGTTTTDKKGAFRKTFTASKSGTWRASYGGSATYIASTSSTDNVQVGVKTAFTSAFNASPEPVAKGKALKVAGKLNRYVGGKWIHAGAGAAIQIQFKAAGSSTWTTLGTTKTTSAGTFAKYFTASKDGTWRAVYGGSTTYIGSTSGTDYVDVR
ncbi:hypothetical protein [Actinomadura atramentaria]|uniref:hypothetical protein n=1 Tax=Actinomadura atramentaria TaxID=1990 RepID=UPI0012F7EF1C|nr:hypothetical protein [Actinomadura atramentaria]